MQEDILFWPRQQGFTLSLIFSWDDIECELTFNLKEPKIEMKNFSGIIFVFRLHTKIVLQLNVTNILCLAFSSGCERSLELSLQWLDWWWQEWGKGYSDSDNEDNDGIIMIMIMWKLTLILTFRHVLFPCYTSRKTRVKFTLALWSF